MNIYRMLDRCSSCTAMVAQIHSCSWVLQTRNLERTKTLSCRLVVSSVAQALQALRYFAFSARALVSNQVDG